MGLKALQFLAVVLTALALVPAGAHLFALPNKIGLPREEYFIVQGIYRGWALFGAVVIPAVLVDLLLALAVRRFARPCALALLAGSLMAATLVVFFAWTYPANVATRNWTAPTPDWRTLRARWEYAHAAGALLTFGALVLVALSVLATPARVAATAPPEPRESP